MKTIKIIKKRITLRQRKLEMEKHLLYAAVGSLLLFISGCDQVHRNLASVVLSKSIQQINKETKQEIATKGNVTLNNTNVKLV